MKSPAGKPPYSGRPLRNKKLSPRLSLILCALTSIASIICKVVVSYFSRSTVFRVPCFYFWRAASPHLTLMLERLAKTKDYYVYDTTLVGGYSLELPNQQ